MSQDKSSFNEFLVKMPDVLLDRAQKEDPVFNWYLSGGLGIGYSSFAWNGGEVKGTCSCALDAVIQMYSTGKKSFPDWYYGEAALGVSRKGAASFGIAYIDLDVHPVGYYHDFDNLRVVGKLGFYSGIPCNSLRYAGRSRVDFGVMLGTDIEYRMLSLGLSFSRGFPKIATSNVELRNWRLVVNIKCKIMSF